MPLFISNTRQPDEKACLVGIKLPRSTMEEEWRNLRELEQLALAAGAEVVMSTVQQRTRIDGTSYIGKGKLAWLAEEIPGKQINLVIFDDDLSPAQARNIEESLKVNVVDRTELILDIFSRRAKTKQASIQVEIAQLTYALPRLTRLWEHLSRQAGGIGTKGPGETQLEVDRRKIRERISHLKKELKKIEAQVVQGRKQRSEAYNVTIAGYTNAGKSTLLNRLSGSEVHASSQLFSTLDSTSRRVDPEGGAAFVLTDTIGFIRKLPTHLVAGFRATLMDVKEADLLLHLVDASEPGHEERIAVVNEVLGDVIGGRGGGEKGSEAGHIPTILVFNKADNLPEGISADNLRARHPGAVVISAATGEGTGELLAAITAEMEKEMITAVIRIPVRDGRTIAMLEANSTVRRRELEGETMVFEASLRRRDLGRIESSGEVEISIGRGE